MRETCLYCGEVIELQLSWRAVWGRQDKILLCRTCREALHPICGTLCPICGRMLERLPAQYVHDGRCYDCIRWKQEGVPGIFRVNRSLYVYNDFLKELLAKYKFRGDYVLGSIFAMPLQQSYKKHFFGHAVVPIPLSNRRLYERRFNQAEQLASFLGAPVYDVLQRVGPEGKQSKKSRRQRLEQHGAIFIPKPEAKELQGCFVVIVDDIYTTGATVRMAAKALEKAGVRAVSSLTVARGDGAA